MKNKNRKLLLSLLNDTKEVLENNNITFWLEYGTLLGIIRDNDFIPWETDIDLGCWKLKDDYAIKQKLKSDFQEMNYNVYLTDGHINIRPENEPNIWLDINFYLREKDKAVTLGWTFPASLNRISQILNYLIIFLFNKKNYLRKLKFMFTPLFSTIYIVFRCTPPLLREKIINLIIFIRDNISKTQKMGYGSKYIDNLEKIRVFEDVFFIPGDAENYLKDGYGEDWRIPQKQWDWEKEFGFIK